MPHRLLNDAILPVLLVSTLYYAQPAFGDDVKDPQVGGFEAVNMPLPIRAGWADDQRDAHRMLPTGLSVTYGVKEYGLPTDGSVPPPDPLAAFGLLVIERVRQDELGRFYDLWKLPGERDGGPPKSIKNVTWLRDHFRTELGVPEAAVRLDGATDYGTQYGLEFSAPDGADGRRHAGFLARPGVGGGFYRPVTNIFTPAQQAAASAARSAFLYDLEPIEVPADAKRVPLETEFERTPEIPITLNVPLVPVAAASDLPGGVAADAGAPLPRAVAGPVGFFLNTFRPYRAGETDAVLDRLGPESRAAFEEPLKKSPDALDGAFLDHARHAEVVAAIPGDPVTIIWAREFGGDSQLAGDPPGKPRYYFVAKADGDAADAESGYYLVALKGVRPIDTVLRSQAVRKLVERAARLIRH